MGGLEIKIKIKIMIQIQIQIEAGTHHVVGPFTRVPEVHVLRHDFVEHHLHVVPHIGVPVLVDGEAGRGVEQLYVH